MLVYKMKNGMWGDFFSDHSSMIYFQNYMIYLVLKTCIKSCHNSFRFIVTHTLCKYMNEHCVIFN
jgi:hypothetical protein